MVDFLESAPWWLRKVLKSAQLWGRVEWDRSSDEDWLDDKRESVTTLWSAEAMSSEYVALAPHQMNGVRQGEHLIALDIDFEAALIPSSQKHRYHLIFNRTAPWEKVEALLIAMRECGLLERGYVDASIHRKSTFLRLPWIRKGHEVEDQKAAYQQWLERPLENRDAPWVRRDQTIDEWLESGVA